MSTTLDNNYRIHILVIISGVSVTIPVCKTLFHPRPHLAAPIPQHLLLFQSIEVQAQQQTLAVLTHVLLRRSSEGVDARDQLQGEARHAQKLPQGPPVLTYIYEGLLRTSAPVSSRAGQPASEVMEKTWGLMLANRPKTVKPCS